jgi:hypothetical protein
MAKVIVYTNAEFGNVCVCRPTGEVPLRDVLEKDCPPGSVIIEEGLLPYDGGYFMSWRLKNNRVVIDMPTAREIHRNRMRHTRGPLMAALDIAFMRAFESGNTALINAVKAQKEALRDVTTHPDIEAAQTIDELLKVWPDCLMDFKPPQEKAA